MGKPLKITLVLAWVACCSGCKQVCEWTDDFSCAIDACTFGECIQPAQPSTCLTSPPCLACPDIPCEEGTKEPEAFVINEDSSKETATATPTAQKQECDIVAPVVPACPILCPILHLGMHKTKHGVRRRPEPNIAYEPPMPPKFLLVPTEKVFSQVNMLAPTPRRGDVEVNFGPQLNIPGHD